MVRSYQERRFWESGRSRVSEPVQGTGCRLEALAVVKRHELGAPCGPEHLRRRCIGSGRSNVVFAKPPIADRSGKFSIANVR